VILTTTHLHHHGHPSPPRDHLQLGSRLAKTFYLTLRHHAGAVSTTSPTSSRLLKLQNKMRILIVWSIHLHKACTIRNDCGLVKEWTSRSKIHQRRKNRDNILLLLLLDTRIQEISYFKNTGGTFSKRTYSQIDFILWWAPTSPTLSILVHR